MFLLCIEKELPLIRRPSKDDLKSELTDLKALTLKRLILLLMGRERNIQMRGKIVKLRFNKCFHHNLAFRDIQWAICQRTLFFCSPCHLW